jgi:hypothetical protein
MGHPILIYQGGKDFKNLLGKDKKHFKRHNYADKKSRFILPEENHWVLKPQTHKFGKKNFLNG